MPTQYEQGPAAAAAEKGMALDELFQRDRSANKRAMLEQAGAMARQGQQQKFTAEQAGVAHARDLEKMLKGEELKEQFATREAERAAPFIERLVGGNQSVAKAFGFTAPGEAYIDRRGAMAEPEAMGITAPTVTPQVPRAPTREEAMGLAKAVPGIAQTLLQQQMKGGEGYSLAQGAKRFNANNELVAENPKAGESNKLFASGKEAMADAIANGMDPQRVEITHTKDGVSWKQSVTGSLAETPDAWQAKMNDPNVPAGERERARVNLEAWEARQKRIAVMKEGVKPLSGEMEAKITKQNEAITAAYKLLSFSPSERAQFTGLIGRGVSEVKNITKGVADALGIGNPLDTSLNDRFVEFKRLNGMAEQFKFAVGGKQLTTGEQKVVEAFIPTGRELSQYEYEAKLRGIAGAMQAAQDVDLYLAKTGKADVNGPELRALYVEALKKHGIDVEELVKRGAKDAARSQMNSDQRLRDKYLNKDK